MHFLSPSDYLGAFWIIGALVLAILGVWSNPGDDV